MHAMFIDNAYADKYVYALEGAMRTTLDLPEKLIEEAMTITQIKTKTELIKTALKNLIQKEKIKELKKYYGKVPIEADLDAMRDR
jgi:Arc/MetJ family transcription regulator